MSGIRVAFPDTRRTCKCCTWFFVSRARDVLKLEELGSLQKGGLVGD